LCLIGLLEYTPQPLPSQYFSIPSNHPFIRRQIKWAIEEMALNKQRNHKSDYVRKFFLIHELHYVISLLLLTPSNGSFFACFLCYEKMKVGLCNLCAICVSACLCAGESPVLTFERLDQSLLNLVCTSGY
jgi:hypothetical protein